MKKRQTQGLPSADRGSQVWAIFFGEFGVLRDSGGMPDHKAIEPLSVKVICIFPQAKEDFPLFLFGGHVQGFGCQYPLLKVLGTTDSVFPIKDQACLRNYPLNS